MPESLDDDDLLEMVNAGLLPAIVVDDYLAAFWKKVLPEITLHPQAPLRTGGDLAVAFRKGSPKLLPRPNAFSGKWGQGTAFGNIERKKYLESTRYAKSATAEAERKKFESVLDLFRKYGEQYNVDSLLMAAQGYQESQLDQNAGARSAPSASCRSCRRPAPTEGRRHHAARSQHPCRREVHRAA